jgi:HD-GYP domain-containing protein (c-di-GMP phosphodiesterase class II)
VFWEGTTLESLESVDSRRFLPHALIATFLVIVAPALVVIALSPLSGFVDLLVSAVLATGLSVAAGSAAAALWTRLSQSREIPFGDLMLWAWARRVRAERRLAKATSVAEPLDVERELAALRRLGVIFEARDGFSHGHSGRVARHAERIARRLGLPDDEVERIEAAAAVHDVGMVRVPGSVLARQDDLTEEESGLVERHTIYGAEQVAAVADPKIAELVRHHHERVDGTGYPDGLVGDAIPLGARIIAVADRFDELTSPAPQRSARSRRNALDELSARAGTELDAAVVAAFVAYYSGTRSIAGVALAATAPQRAVRWMAAAPATIGSAVGTPAIIQGVCASATLAVAGSCLTGMPVLAPDRGGDRPAVEQRAERAPVGDRAGATSLASTSAPSGGGGTDGGAKQRRRDAGGGLGGGESPQTGGPDTPASGGGGGTPVATQPGGGGGTQPTGGGGGGSGGTSPSTPGTSQPSAPVTAPPVQAPQTPSNTVSQVVDPVLDGVSEAVPPIKPVTDTVKGIVGGLTGGLTGGGR